jgi:16S rRNA (uracil1498-N3)-methyltransferase
LRVQAGQQFEIAGEGRVRLGNVVRVAPDRVEFELGEDVPVSEVAPVTLFLAVFKFDRMEWAIEKCTELGVTRLVPLVCARTDSHLAAAACKRAQRWARLVLQASEQSRRPAPPEIALPQKLSSALERGPGIRIVLDESERDLRLRDALKNFSPPSGDSTGEKAQEVSLAVGPEGGWTEAELDLFSSRGWVRASLGPTILRAETAAIAALAVLMSELR